MKVKLLSHTQNPEKIVACAAKLCYSSSSIDELYDGLDENKIINFLDMLTDLGHFSPIEHAYFTFGIEGVSRSLLAQITRHRIASYSVQSQRYVSENNFSYVIPPEIENNKKAKEIYINVIDKDLEAYNELTDILEKHHEKEFINQGINEKKAKNMAKKKAIEDARFVLPNSCNTKMVMTMNARSLNNFFSLRCCNRAQWEIRELAIEMYKLVYKIAPRLFKFSGPACLRGKCSEGNMSCGKAEEVKKRFDDIKKELDRENG